MSSYQSGAGGDGDGGAWTTTDVSGEVAQSTADAGVDACGRGEVGTAALSTFYDHSGP